MGRPGRGVGREGARVCVCALTESDRRRPTLPRRRATLHQDGNGFIDVQELKEALQEWGQSAEAAGPGGALGVVRLAAAFGGHWHW